MSESKILFETPQRKYEFSKNIKFIINTDTMAYFIIDDGSIYRTLIANLKNDNINPIQFRHQPWGNSQIKRIATYFVIQRNVRCFSLIVLADSQLYVIPEDQFQSSITIQPLSLTDCDYIDDFCVTPSGDRLCVLSKKKITYYSTSNNFSQISKMVECVDSNITCNNDNVLVYGKGVQMFSIGFSTRGIDYQSTAIRKAGCAYGIIQNEFDSINNCELSATYQFYLLRSKGNYDDVKNQISFIGDGPYTNFKWPIQDEIVDFTISYPYAFATHGKTFEMICIPNQKLVQSTTFNSSFNNQTICPLPNRTLLIGLGSTLLFLRFIEANLQVRASMNAAKVPGADVANALHTAISVCLSFPEYEPEISTLKKELFHSYGEELLNKKNTVKAIEYFKRDQLPAHFTLRNFGDWIPSETLKEEKNREIWQGKTYKSYLMSKDKTKVGIQQYDSNSVNALKEYIELVKKTQQPDEYLNRVLNSILLKCEAVINTDNIRQFIKNTPNIFFESTCAFLVNLQLYKDFYYLCETHKQHNKAIDFFHKQKKIDDLITYIQESDDFDELSRQEFGWVSENYPQRAADIFCSQKIEQVNVFHSSNDKQGGGLLGFIQSIGRNEYSSKIDPIDVEIHFLVFCVFTKGFQDPKLRQRLCELYLSKLHPVAESRRGKSYIPIRAEKEPTKSFRTGLLKVLEISDGLDFKDDVDSCFIEEKLIAMMSDDRLDECFDLVCRPGIEFSIATNFCETASKKLKLNPTDVFTQLLIRLSENDTDESRHNIVELVNSKADQIDYVMAIKKLPRSVKLNEITPLLASVSVDRVNELRKLSIENALLEETLRRKRQQLAYLRGGFVEITPHSFCAVCGLEFIEQPFIVKPDNTINHILCNGQFKNLAAEAQGQDGN